MYVLRIIVLLLLVASAALPVAAQAELVSRIDSLLDRREERFVARYDTAYLAKPKEKWTVKMRVNRSRNELDMEGLFGGSGYRFDLKSEPRITVGASASYRGLSLALTLNPMSLTGRNTDYEFNLYAYGNRFGADVAFSHSKTLHGRAGESGAETEIRAGQVAQSMIQASAYYAFNYRRFSFPAAFTQSQIQKRSCGTWLLGLSVFGGRIGVDGDAEEGSMETGSLRSLNVALGGGYAHHFVLKRKWLIHLSVMPQIAAYSFNRMRIGGERQRTDFEFPTVIVVGRMALVRHFGNHFVGFSSVVNVWDQGEENQLSVSTVRIRARLFYGLRF